MAETTRTYYVRTLGEKELSARLMQELTKIDCHKFGNECHAFRALKDESEVKGASRLLQVNITQGKYNLQIFKRDGKSLRRILNAGNFKPKKDHFFESLVKSSINITFK